MKHAEGVRLESRGRTLDLSTPVIMGVLNVTPDSFSDGGRHADERSAIEHGLRMLEEGAAILDVGGESTRPGAEPVPLEEELGRVVPVIEALRARSDVWISVDTSKPEVMRRAAAAGADLLNDVRALGAPGALEAAAGTGCAVCLMHMQGTPGTMQRAPVYDDVVREVRDFLLQRARACESAGIAPNHIVIDPGIGFGKTYEHNLALIAALPDLCRAPYPVLLGVSRKSLLGRMTGRPEGARLHAGLAVAALAAQGGVRIVRTHDVGPTVDALRAVRAVREGK